jgi:hypothetical protein
LASTSPASGTRSRCGTHPATNHPPAPLPFSALEWHCPVSSLSRNLTANADIYFDYYDYLILLVLRVAFATSISRQNCISTLYLVPLQRLRAIVAKHAEKAAKFHS